MTDEEKAARRQKRIDAIEQSGQFTGSQQFYKYMGGCLLTEGVKHVVDTAECYWFTDIIASYQGTPWAKREDFQVWKLTCYIEKGTAVVVCEDGNDNKLVEQKVGMTDFPAREVTFWAERNELGGMTILLPSEH